MTDEAQEEIKISKVTIESYCSPREWLHVSIRTGMHLLDDHFFMENGTIAIRYIEEGQTLCVHKEWKNP